MIDSFGNYASTFIISIFFDSGQEIVAGNDIYGGSDRLLSQVVPKAGVVVKLVILPVLVFSNVII